MSAPIILVPGFWLGAWAWDEVASLLRDEGHDVTPLTLPGLESMDADRSSVTASDHVAAIGRAIEAAGRPVVLVVHSGAGYTGYAASDWMPERIAAMVYVDSAPGIGAMDADFLEEEKPLAPLEELREQENLDGISDEQLATFYERAVPEPGGVIRGSVPLTNNARLDVPTTVICTAYTAEDYQKYAKEGYGWLAGLNEVRNIDYVDLPTSHWPMWSRPRELAEIIGRVANEAG